MTPDDPGSPKTDKPTQFEAVLAQARAAIDRLEAAMPRMRWSRQEDVPAPPEGGTAEGYSGDGEGLRLLIIHFKSGLREGYDGTLVVFSGGATIIHLPEDCRKRIFERARDLFNQQLPTSFAS